MAHWPAGGSPGGGEETPPPGKRADRAFETVGVVVRTQRCSSSTIRVGCPPTRVD